MFLSSEKLRRQEYLHSKGMCVSEEYDSYIPSLVINHCPRGELNLGIWENQVCWGHDVYH